MKKISLRGISELLSEKELKNVMGGSSKCCYSKSWTSSTTYSCSSASDCESKAGASGWWCCNCSGCA